MIRPDYREIQYLSHSAKGSVWDKHKYVKRVDGIYYYPSGYEGGRTMESFRKDLRNKRFTQKQVSSDASNKSTSSSSSKKSSSTTVRKSLATKTVQKRSSLSGFRTPLKSTDAAEKLKTSSKKKITDKDLSAKDIEKFAKEVIRGNYGNGAERKKALGDNYRKIQDKVNEMLRGGTKKISSTTKTTTSKISSDGTSTKKKKSAKSAKKKTSSDKKTTTVTSKPKGVDLDKVYSVYNKRKR